MRVAKGLNFSGYEPTQLISEHTFLCTAKFNIRSSARRSCAALVRRAGFRRDSAAQIVGMYVVSTYILVEYPRLSLNLAHIDKTHSIS